MILSRRHAFGLVVVLLTNVAVGGGTALAAGQRSFVSTSGVDNPTCSIAAPCRAFAAAITATSAGGEIIVLDSGGYGPVTIAQSVSIIASPGAYAGISVTSGHGVTIATAINSIVVLRGLSINNQGSTGRGIYITGEGVVRIEDVQVAGFTGASGLKAAPSGPLELHIRHSVFRNNSFGIALNYGGAAETMQINGTLADIEISGSAGDGLAIGNNTTMALSHSLIIKNAGRGIGTNPVLGQVSNLSVDDCEIAQNNQAVYPGDSPGTSSLQVSRSRIVGNITGIAAGLNSFTRLSNSVIENNVYGINIPINLGGIVLSAGNNVLNGNANDEPVLSTFPLR
ncbi:MAG: right-handed parallel beta-helix repeat-containing protein [Casimicrobiaceae bacterium]